MVAGTNTPMEKIIGIAGGQNAITEFEDFKPLYVDLRTKNNTQRINLAILKIKEEQDLLVEELKGKGLITEVEYYYSTIINAIAVKTTYGNFKEIGKYFMRV